MRKPATRATQPLKTPVQARSQRTVQTLLAAAVQVFERHGYAAGTTARIAERAGVSVGSLYQYFPNKDALLVALAGQHLDGLATIATRHLKAARDPALPLAAVVDELVDGFLALHLDNPALHRLLSDPALQPAVIRERLAGMEVAFRDGLARVLSRRSDVRATDLKLLAYIVQHTLEHFTHRLALDPDAPGPRAAAVAELKHLLLGYLRREPG